MVLVIEKICDCLYMSADSHIKMLKIFTVELYPKLKINFNVPMFDLNNISPIKQICKTISTYGWFNIMKIEQKL